jgi:Bacterial capsule synthesis protein PGA_cap
MIGWLRTDRGLVSVLCAFALSGSTVQAGTLEFSHACDLGERLTIATVGDLLFQEPLQRVALMPFGTYAGFWQPVGQYLRAPDLLYGNLEGPAAHGVILSGQETADPGRVYDGRVYGTAPSLAFNYHPSLLQDLKASGFAVVSTANNHALDRGSLGVERTIDNLRSAGIAFTGTRKRDDPTRRWSVVTTRKNFSVAWLACTAWTNDRPDPYQQVHHCYRDKTQLLGEISNLASDPGVDAVVLTPHWGVEDLQRPLAGDRALATMALKAGATAVIGAHPHVLQPWEKWIADDGREGLIVYSLGNFISNHRTSTQRSGAIVGLELLKAKSTQKAVLAAAWYVPTWVDFNDDVPLVQENIGVTEESARALMDVLNLLPSGNRISGDDLLQQRPKCTGKDTVFASGARP